MALICVTLRAFSLLKELNASDKRLFSELGWALVFSLVAGGLVREVRRVRSRWILLQYMLSHEQLLELVVRKLFVILLPHLLLGRPHFGNSFELPEYLVVLTLANQLFVLHFRKLDPVVFLVVKIGSDSRSLNVQGSLVQV